MNHHPSPAAPQGQRGAFPNHVGGSAILRPMNGFNHTSGLRVLSCLLLVTGLLLGCASGPKDAAAPGAALSEEDATKREQRLAIKAVAEQIQSGEMDNEVGRETLKRYAWRRAAPNDIRIAAIDALIENDPQDTARMLALMLPTETDWEVIGSICELAADGGWQNMAPALVRSWSRPVLEPADPDRPERAALIALFPDQSVETTVYDVFASPPDDRFFGERARMDAWALLQRIDEDGSQTKALLAENPSQTPTDALHGALLDGAQELQITPRTTDQLMWLQSLRQPERRGYWDEVTEVVASLNTSQLEGFEIRHLEPIRWAAANEPSWLASSREDLLDRLETELDGRKRSQRTDGYVDFTGDSQETLNTWRDRLCWGDVLVLLIGARVVEDDELAVDFFEQAIRDQSDRSTEYGGVIDSQGDEFVAVLYPPRPAQRLGDQRFVASAELIEASHTALFHYHFHAQRNRNAAFAGPGRGDLEYAEQLGRSCLVLTLVSANELNVDCYLPTGARIDLGGVSRPR